MAIDPKIQKSWENFLDPKQTRKNLISASIFIAGFESLKDAIVEHLKYFYWCGFDESGHKFDPSYNADVLSRNKSPVYASLDWLKESKAIGDADIKAFDRVKECRNKLAHKLFSTLGAEGLPPEYSQRFDEMVCLLRKIEVWWITQVEIPTNPDFDGEEIDVDGIQTGGVMGLRLLWDIALGDKESSQHYLNEFRKHGEGC